MVGRKEITSNEHTVYRNYRGNAVVQEAYMDPKTTRGKSAH